MQDYEIDAYLGDFADEATAEQKTWIGQAADAIDAILRETYKDDADTEGFKDDIAEMSSAPFSAAVQVILGDATLEEFGRAEAQAFAAYREAVRETTGAMVAARIMGATPTEIAQQAGVTRRTVYKRLQGM